MLVFELRLTAPRGVAAVLQTREPNLSLCVKIPGCALLVMGLIWILQGVNILPGSFMTGQIAWAWRGAAMAVAGVLVLVAVSPKRR